MEKPTLSSTGLFQKLGINLSLGIPLGHLVLVTVLGFQTD